MEKKLAPVEKHLSVRPKMVRMRDKQELYGESTRVFLLGLSFKLESFSLNFKHFSPIYQMLV